MIIEILVAQRKGKDTLADQFLDRMFGGLGITVIDKLPGQPLQDAGALIDLTQQQLTTIGTDLSAVEFGNHRAASQAVKCQLFRFTLCFHKVVFSCRHN